MHSTCLVCNYGNSRKTTIHYSPTEECVGTISGVRKGDISEDGSTSIGGTTGPDSVSPLTDPE